VTLPGAREVVESYLDRGFHLVFWPAIDDWKGPREADWLKKGIAGDYTLDKYKDGDRVGIMHGVEVSVGKYLIDVDIDWAPGAVIAKAMLPVTGMVWGRTSKQISHCLYTAPDVVPMQVYKDIGKNPVTLIEFRADKHQSMAPPSIWQKDTKQEPLAFVLNGVPAHLSAAQILKDRTCLAAIGMILALHLGRNGFGHAVRLSWAGFLLRAGISAEDLIAMGNAMSLVCNNTEIGDVRGVVESTVDSLATKGKKTAGGPSLEKFIGDQGKDVTRRIREWLGQDGFVMNEKGSIIASDVGNIQRAVELLNYTTTYDMFSGTSLINGQEMTTDLFREIRFKIEITHRFQPPKEYLYESIDYLCYENRFHPIKDYLGSLTWDKTPRIETWLVETAGTENTEYIRAVSAIMLIAAVRRITQPGCKYDEMVVLESHAQGLNKSTALRTLCPHENWFSDDFPLNADGQRVIEATSGKWIIEASELVGRRAEREHLKSMLSRQTDRARLAYAHTPINKPREFIIVGTTNSDDYLGDPSGSRRFWPIRIKAFDVVKLREIRDQLWAEAVHYETKGVSIRLPEKLWPVAGEEQSRRNEENVFQDLVREVLIAQPVLGGRRRLSSEVLWTALGIELKDRTRQYRTFSDVMTRLGFRKITVREDDKVKGGWISVHIGDPALMQANQMDREPDREVGDDDGDDEGNSGGRKGGIDDIPF